METDSEPFLLSSCTRPLDLNNTVKERMQTKINRWSGFDCLQFRIFWQKRRSQLHRPQIQLPEPRNPDERLPSGSNGGRVAGPVAQVVAGPAFAGIEVQFSPIAYRGSRRRTSEASGCRLEVFSPGGRGSRRVTKWAVGEDPREDNLPRHPLPPPLPGAAVLTRTAKLHIHFTPQLRH